MIEQIIIAVTGVIAIWLTQDRRASWRRYACLFGLAGQPFWLYSLWGTDQWGMLVVSVFYTAAWGRGFWVHWCRHES